MPKRSAPESSPRTGLRPSACIRIRLGLRLSVQVASGHLTQSCWITLELMKGIGSWRPPPMPEKSWPVRHWHSTKHASNRHKEKPAMVVGAFNPGSVSGDAHRIAATLPGEHECHRIGWPGDYAAHNPPLAKEWHRGCYGISSLQAPIHNSLADEPQQSKAHSENAPRSLIRGDLRRHLSSAHSRVAEGHCLYRLCPAYRA